MNREELKVAKPIKLVEFLLDNHFSYNEVLKMLRKKDVRVNGVKVGGDVMLSAGDAVCVYFKEKKKLYDIIYDGETCAVVYKYPSIETVELAKLLNMIAVHRLDRNTEGLVVFARTVEAQERLENAFKKHLVNKFYLAEVVGYFDVDKLYTAYLVKDAKRSLVKIFDKCVSGSKKIETKMTTLKASKASSLLKVQIIGGKTHQIRAHLAHLGHAIVGDGKYGRREDYQKFKAKHQMLFAYKLEFQKIGLEELDGKTFIVLPSFAKEMGLKLD